MKDNQRAVFVIDPEKWMPKESDGAWRLVVRDLPEKIKLVFPQRPDDVLTTSGQFCGLKNVVRIPEKEVGILDAQAIDKLVASYAVRTGLGANELHKAIERYEGHPYAVAAALGLIEDDPEIEKLPIDPTPEGIVKEQRARAFGKSGDAVKLLEAYAILEVGVPDDVVEAVGEVSAASRKSLMEDKYVGSLLREEGYGQRIYHAILADYILEQIGEDEKKEYHKCASEVYRKQLDCDIKRENLAKIRMAAIRLPEHVMEGEGKGAFVDTVVNKCIDPLSDLGELETAKQLGRRALETSSEDSTKVSKIVRQLASICWKQGQLKKAELLIKADMKTVKKEKREEDMRHYSFMLAGIFQQRGQIDEAEKIYNKILQDNKKLGKTEDGEIFTNLGVIYWMKGRFKKAANMQRKALRIYAESKNKEGMSEAYGNFGAIYLSKGDLKKAFYAIKKSLNLTNRVDVIASMCSNLASIHMTCGRFDDAEDTLRKTLTINMGMGNIEGVARDLANLGGIHFAKGEIDTARDVWIKARDGYDIVGMKDMAKKVEGWIRGLGRDS